MEDLLSFIQTVSDDTALDQLWQRESKSDYARFSESETAALGLAVLDLLARIQREDLREALLVILSRLTLSPEGFEPRLLAPFQKSSSSKTSVLIRVGFLRCLYGMCSKDMGLSRAGLTVLRDYFARTDSVGREFLLLSGVMLSQGLGDLVAQRVTDAKYRKRLRGSFQKIREEFDRKQSDETIMLARGEMVAISVGHERIFLTLLTMLEPVFRRVPGAESDPSPVGSASHLRKYIARCGDCGHKVDLKNDRTGMKMQLKCAKCGAVMSLPPDTE